MCHQQMVLNCTDEKVQVTGKSIVISITILGGIVMLKGIVRSVILVM